MITITESKKTKIGKCRDCGDDICCNKFEGAARIHCHESPDCQKPHLQGSWLRGDFENMSEIASMTGSEISETSESNSPQSKQREASNGVPESLVGMHPEAIVDCDCPMCKKPMEFVTVQPKMGIAGFICTECLVSIEIRADWARLMVRALPKKWKKIAKEFNESQESYGTGTGWGAV